MRKKVRVLQRSTALKSFEALKASSDSTAGEDVAHEAVSAWDMLRKYGLIWDELKYVSIIFYM